MFIYYYEFRISSLAIKYFFNNENTKRKKFNLIEFEIN